MQDVCLVVGCQGLVAVPHVIQAILRNVWALQITLLVVCHDLEGEIRTFSSLPKLEFVPANYKAELLLNVILLFDKLIDLVIAVEFLLFHARWVHLLKGSIDLIVDVVKCEVARVCRVTRLDQTYGACFVEETLLEVLSRL